MLVKGFKKCVFEVAGTSKVNQVWAIVDFRSIM